MHTRSGGRQRIGLVACVKSKLDHPAAAQDLYTSPLFRGARATVVASCDRWFVLSAEHHLVDPETVLDPYERTLKTASRVARRQWSAEVLNQLHDLLGDLAEYVFEIHAGRDYHDFGLSVGLRDAGAEVELPLEGLTMGQRLAYYASERPAAARSPERSARGTSYAGLTDHLGALESERWEATFAEVEGILGRTLPASAAKHRAWWSAGQSHARAWTGPGWRVAALDLRGRTVTFERAPGSDQASPAPNSTHGVSPLVVGSRADALASPGRNGVSRIGLLEELHARLHAVAADRGTPRLADCAGRDGWPRAGVYFFFEDGELREDGSTPRVVRVGTHALNETSKTKLWTRLRTHRGATGSTHPGGGNHRASIFRLHVGTALINRGGYDIAARTWSQRSGVPRATRDLEVDLERAVSVYIGAMRLIVVEVTDWQDRARLEQDCIALLSNHDRPATDSPSSSWLGLDADRHDIRSSGLWNVSHVRDPAPHEPALHLVG